MEIINIFCIQFYFCLHSQIQLNHNFNNSEVVLTIAILNRKYHGFDINLFETGNTIDCDEMF